MKLINVKHAPKNEAVFTVDKKKLANAALTKITKSALALASPLILSMIRKYTNQHLFFTDKLFYKMNHDTVCSNYKIYLQCSVTKTLTYFYLQNPENYKFNSCINNEFFGPSDVRKSIKSFIKKESVVSIPEEGFHFIKHAKYDAYILYKFDMELSNELLSVQSGYFVQFATYSLSYIIFGREFYKAKNDLLNFISEKKKVDPDQDDIDIQTHVYNPHSHHIQNFINSISAKTWDDIIMDEDVKKSILYQFESFFRQEELYRKRHWNHKLNVLFKGPAGTGKTSLTYIIFSYFFKFYLSDTVKEGEVIAIYHSIKATDIKYFEQMIEGDTVLRRYEFIVIEELDTIMEDNDSVLKLMQIMDGPLSRNRYIIICNTNYPDRIDPRILERFNIVEEVDRITEEDAISLCKKYDIDDDNTKEILEQCKVYDKDKEEYRYVPRQIENAIKKCEARKFTFNDNFNKSLKEDEIELTK